ncbi:MAG: S41 family peptidase [Planctomycetes bacterium]|nr:S41 family peptidase [Planctomycetota bacterium]
MNTLTAAALCLFPLFAFAEPPRVVSAVPDIGDVDVDPDLAELRIEFDQDMGAGRSLCGGGPLFPAMKGSPRWETPRIIVIPVNLEPGHEYRFMVNCPSAQNFRSKEGLPAEITQMYFRTAKDAASASPPRTLTPAENSPAIDAFKKAINEGYSYRDLRVKDWDALFAANEEAMMSARTPGAFARAAVRVLAPAKDIHAKVWVNDASLPTFHANSRRNVNLQLVEKTVPGFLRKNDTVAVGKFEDSIGYLQILTWPGENDSPSVSIEPALSGIDDLMDCKALIIDVRANGGGAEPAAKRVAARFVEKPATYSLSQYRDRESPSGFTQPIARVVKPDPNKPRFTGRVVVLIGQACASSNESFIAMMKHGANATLIGEKTLGSSGNPRRTDLGNGVQISLPSWRDLMPDGSLLEGVGISPDVAAGQDANFESNDPVLDAALAAVRSGH